MACGCFLIAGLVAALVYCAVQGLWLIAAGVLAVTGLVCWLGYKAMKGPQKPL